MLSNINEEQRSQLLSQLDTLRSVAEKGIEQNGGSWNCPAGKNMIAYNVLTGIIGDLNKESSENDDDFTSQ